MGQPWIAAMILGLAIAGPAAAAPVKTTFTVSVTVVAACRVVAGQADPCARAKASAVATEKPVVTYSRDPKTGAVIQTIEF